ncbi:hypothetical protein MKZ38_004024 [Zalerion maritima]|uniref:Kelch repeat-containing protein n=1 Tax=Zalerion maritima TaxID=339359 RepID=A0AAD5WRD2_9PEZI|nr:hypothetical protein MKZ38_004024 [Zalerion maritima]
MGRSHCSTGSLLALVSSLAITPLTSAQHSGWQEGQVNATMCMWQQPRAAVIKDTVYIDGGYLWWTPGMATKEYGVPTQDGNPLGLIFTLNFSTPFNSSQNLSSLFDTMSKVPNEGAATNIAPNYFDGGMLANNHEWFTYGGLLTKTDAFEPPDEDYVLGYLQSSYGVEKPNFKSGFLSDKLPEEMTRYITYGGAVNAPSENKAWYFGGMVGDHGQEIFVPTGNEDTSPTNHSDTLMLLDMGTQYSETWHNMSLPDDIKGRANPEVVWVPVGEQGILVVLGGVLYPEFAQATHKSANEAASQDSGDDFMSVIDIYDIANDKWYQQPTAGGPTARTRGCAVVSPASDYSSLNIYWYGGYDGLHPTADFYDDIWILSLPSFLWTQVSSGRAIHGRAGHKCVMPYPDQMMVIGGYTTQQGGSLKCLDGGVIELVNLTDGQWLDAYHPEKYHDYGVPEKVHAMIGGDWSGGATMLTPTPTGWADPDLASVFATPYDVDKLQTYYPYQVEEAYVRGEAGGGWPKWATPVLVVLLVLLIAAVLGFIWFILRKRKQMAKRDGTEGSEESGNRIISWIRGQPSEKAATVTTEETPTSPIPRSQAPLPPQPQETSVHYEMPDTSVAVEMMDTSPRAELSDTGLNHGDVIDKHTHLGQQNGNGNGNGNGNDINNPSYFSGSGISQMDHASPNNNSAAAVSPGVGSTGNSTTPPRPQPPQASPMNHPESPSLGAVESPSTPPQRMASAASGLTSATGHVRDESVSTLGDVDRSGSPLQPPGQAPFSPPVSPPQLGEEFGARGPVSPQHPGSPSPLRRSVFYENEDDMGGRRV